MGEIACTVTSIRVTAPHVKIFVYGLDAPAETKGPTVAMIPEDEIERIKRGTDLAAVIRARGVELKPQGGDLVGRCPFHDDHDPSLRVTPAKGLWRCMSSACGATGNVIQFVQRFDGVSFRHAYELLKNGAAFTGAPTCQPVKKGTVPRLASPLASSADDLALMRQVVDYHHERLKENPAALDYLQKRGISAEAISTFRIGFVDRTLGLRLPQKNRAEGAAMRARLTAMGFIRSTGHEHLRGRVVFPVPGRGQRRGRGGGAARRPRRGMPARDVPSRPGRQRIRLESHAARQSPRRATACGAAHGKGQSVFRRGARAFFFSC